MGVFIRGMEMPEACVYRENGHLTTCPLYDIDGYCGALNTEASHNEGRKLPGCPLVPVAPHGRLIDADALRYWSDDSAMIAFDYVTRSQINAAPTIIEAEEGE